MNLDTPSLLPCRFIFSEPLSGAMNMALDEALLEFVGNHPVLRIYQWAQPTLSLGYFQRADERIAHKASRDCDLVRRPSGGGAILHDRELTYCLIVPEEMARLQPHTHWYFAVHRALIASINALAGVAGRKDSSGPASAGKLSLCEDRPVLPESEQPFLCFQRRAVGDVLLGEHKIAGSAQRRRGGAILQHGSVLLSRSPHAPELPGISDIVGVNVRFADLSEALAGEISRELALEFEPGVPTQSESAAARRLSPAKYTAASWTHRR